MTSTHPGSAADTRFDPNEPVVVNLGPQYPSTHGVFRLKATLDGERVVDADMIIGYLPRSMEKLAEERTFTQNIPFTDRIDYLAAMSNNLAYCLAVEKLCGIEVPPRAQAIRILFAELQRLASHAMANGTFANDCGAWQTPLFHMFRERERILDMFEMTCGARLTTNYMRIGGVAFDLPPELLPALRSFLDDIPAKIAEYRDLLLGNEILVARSRDVGVIGAATYAENGAGSITITGAGEIVIKTCLGYQMVQNLKGGKPARQAAEEAVLELNARFDNPLMFLVCIDRDGNVGAARNVNLTPHSYWKEGMDAPEGNFASVFE